jgi:metal-responsive CopG/Arc/MetJ family transcriptional regulator
MATASTMKHVGFTVPPPMEEELEQMAKEEHRTKSELFREMVRVYRSYRKRHPEPEINDEWVMQVIREAEEEEKRNPMTDEEEEELEQKLLHYGAEQAKKKGINVKDEEEIDYIIYEARARWREKQKNRT